MLRGVTKKIRVPSQLLETWYLAVFQKKLGTKLFIFTVKKITLFFLPTARSAVGLGITLCTFTPSIAPFGHLAIWPFGHLVILSFSFLQHYSTLVDNS
jgi:hypothetical protein